jgi:FkbM family methyltransferase
VTKTWQKRIVQRVAGAFGITVARKGNAWSLIESEQLERFFDYFGVDCVFDVGANIGQYGERLRALGYRGQIISFEPNPAATETLRRIARRDGRWHVEEVALGSEERDTVFNVTRISEFSSVLEPDHTHTGDFSKMNVVVDRITVHVATLSGCFARLQRTFGFSRPFLKLDTQGHDLAVARGAGSLISGFIGLQSELAFTMLYAGATDYRDTLNYYKQNGFRLCALVPNTAGHFPNLHEMDCIMYNIRYHEGRSPS